MLNVMNNKNSDTCKYCSGNDLTNNIPSSNVVYNTNVYYIANKCSASHSVREWNHSAVHLIQTTRDQPNLF